MNPRIKLLVKKFNLQPHPEGGYYSEIYRSDETIRKEDLPKRYSGKRCFSTSIYFLVLKSNFSAFHRLKSDETWHYYDGSKLEIYVINESGEIKKTILGNDIQKGDVFQFTVKRNSYLAAAVIDGDYSLVGCTVSPGFEFSDFELGKKAELMEMYPEHKEIIDKFTR